MRLADQKNTKAQLYYWCLARQVQGRGVHNVKNTQQKCCNLTDEPQDIVKIFHAGHYHLLLNIVGLVSATAAFQRQNDPLGDRVTPGADIVDAVSPVQLRVCYFWGGNA